MANKELTLEHLTLENALQASISTDYVSGTSLLVDNSAGFSANDFVILGKIGISNTEIAQINAIPNSTSLTLGASGGVFPHASNTTITKIPYDKFRVYRSTSGVGGAYTLLNTLPIQIDQDINVYTDTTAISPYSYKLCYYNSFLDQESGYSDEIPFGGYPDWSLKALQDGILGDFGDREERLITRDDITRWMNYLNYKMQILVSGGESPYYINSAIIPTTGDETYDISSYNMLGVFMIELSYDGGLTYPAVITPKDFRIKDYSICLHRDYRIAGDTLFINPCIPAGKTMRIWYTTTPMQMVNPTDEIPNPFKGLAEVFHDYGMMRAHEKDRKVQEFSIYFQNSVNKALNSTDGIIYKLKRRIRQGNMAIAETKESDNWDW